MDNKSKILPYYKKAMVDELTDNMSAGSSHYYAFVANPIAHNGVVPDASGDDYSNQFLNNWRMVFGKKLFSSDINPVIKRNIWQSNTIYDYYDNTNTNVLANNNFYYCTANYTGGSINIWSRIVSSNSW